MCVCVNVRQSDHFVGLGHSEAEATVDEVNDLKAADCGFMHSVTRPDVAHLSKKRSCASVPSLGVLSLGRVQRHHQMESVHLVPNLNKTSSDHQPNDNTGTYTNDNAFGPPPSKDVLVLSCCLFSCPD